MTIQVTYIKQVDIIDLHYYSCCNEIIDLDNGLCPVCKEHCL